MRISDHIYATDSMLTETVFVQVHLVVGQEYAVLIDSGVADTGPQILGLIEEAGVRPDQVQVLLNTHAHHDHIGSNSQVRAATGCLIAAPSAEAPFISDHAAGYEAITGPWRRWIEIGDDVRDFWFSALDRETRVDLAFGDNLSLDMGGGRVIVAIPLPGHSPGHTGYRERSSGSLILGDALILIDMPWFHVYEDADTLVTSLQWIQAQCRHPGTRQVLSSHYAPAPPHDYEQHIARVLAFVRQVEDGILDALRTAGEPLGMAALGKAAAAAVGKMYDWRAVMVAGAHLRRLEGSRVKRVDEDQFVLAEERP